MKQNACISESAFLLFVVQMKDWGVFVTVDNSRLSCLLHISNISQVNVPSIDVSWNNSEDTILLYVELGNKTLVSEID